MLVLIFLFLLVFGFYGVWRLSRRPPSDRIAWFTIWRVALLIATLRVSALWLGFAGLRRSDWLQVPAYFILMLGLPDIYIAKAARSDPVRWVILCSLTLAATSVIWSSALLWVANRFSSKRPTLRDR